MTAPTTTDLEIDANALLPSYPGGTAETVARIAQRPLTADLFPDDDRAARYIISPEGWEVTEVEPEEPRLAPDRQTGTHNADTVDGFIALLDSLRGSIAVSDIRFRITETHLSAVINAGNVDEPEYEDLCAALIPARSRQIDEWIAACVPTTPDNWARFVEDHAADIDASGDNHPSALDVLTDARTWQVEARKVVKRVRSENGDMEDAEELVAKNLGHSLAAFAVTIPVLRWGAPITLRVALTRDLEKMTFTPRIVGIADLIARLTLEDLEDAVAVLDISPVR